MIPFSKTIFVYVIYFVLLNILATFASTLQTTDQKSHAMSTFEFTNRILQFESILKAFAISLVRNEEAAKDLIQETTYRAIKNQDKFAQGTNLKAWLFTIMKNIFINDYRRRKKSNTIFDNTENQFHLNSHVSDYEPDADTKILIQELTKLIDTLEDDLRIPFLMHYRGYKYREIAEKFGMPLGTVKSRIFHARQLLKEQIRNRYKYVDELLIRA